MAQTDIVTTWSLRIAERAAPDEVEVAPDMARAFVAGGKAKRDLLRQSDSVQGGFGGDIVLVFPQILSAMDAAGPHLTHFLSTVVDHSDVIASFAGTLSSLVNVSSYLERRKKAQSLPDDPYAPLRQVSTILTEELDWAGMQQEEADRIAYKVLMEMIEEPSEAAQFIRKVTQAP